MARLSEIVQWCDERTRRSGISDFPGSHNGLQIENDGEVTRIGAAVDGGIVPFRMAIERKIDFLIVHHGIFWTPPVPLTGPRYQKVKLALDNNLALYGSHLPLDAHPEIGNNALLARELGLEIEGWFLEHEGTPIAAIAGAPASRDELAASLRKLFPHTFTAIEAGSPRPERVAILTGSGRSALDHLRTQGIDTLITGELRQEHFNRAQEEGWNLYPCGHYNTETFGVRELAREVATHFRLPWDFLSTGCPL